MNVNSYTSTLLKSFDILDCFISDSQEIGIKDISAMIDMPQSSVYRIVQSMELGGLIYQNRESKKYRLGPKFISFASKYSGLRAFKDAAVKYMKLLGQETGETVNLAILDCDSIIYIHRVDCFHVLRPSFDLNATYPAYRTGLGMVLLAELNTAGLQWIHQKNADAIGMSLDAFSRLAAQVREQGFAYDDQIFCEGLRCVAAPIRGPGGRAIFSMSVSAPTLRMNDETYDKARRLVMKYAALASTEIQEL